MRLSSGIHTARMNWHIESNSMSSNTECIRACTSDIGQRTRKSHSDM